MPRQPTGIPCIDMFYLSFAMSYYISMFVLCFWCQFYSIWKVWCDICTFCDVSCIQWPLLTDGLAKLCYPVCDINCIQWHDITLFYFVHAVNFIQWHLPVWTVELMQVAPESWDPFAKKKPNNRQKNNWQNFAKKRQIL